MTSLKNNIQSNRLGDLEIIENFTDIAPLLTEKQVLVASERCLFCYDAPCINACPTAIDIPLFIRKINTGNAHGAAKEILSANILGGSCARVCPTETLCEEACVRNTHEDAPVSIGRLQRYAVEHLDPARGYPFTRAPETHKHVAVVGAGPAGLACAHRLAREGHQVTIFEAAKKPGGLNEYGIAEYKLVNDYAQQEVQFVLQIGGIDIQYEKVLGRDFSLQNLRDSYAAVFLGIGMGDCNGLNIPGEDLHGVEDAVDYISELRQADSLAKLPVGKRIVVIGAGMTAIDIAVQSKKLGADNVTIVYRRNQQAMGASKHEQELAQTHGVGFVFNAQPKQILGDENGLQSMQFNRTASDATGKLVTTDEVISVPCDVVFKAIGQKLQPSFLNQDTEHPNLCQSGRLAVNEQMQTSLSGVYAGGDCIKGKDLVVEAVDHGNRAAQAIHQFLQEDKH
ncbi:NAD(P)-dependent oxidoreductase [uncultured Paraglaciecola sp.]|uniref:NAD(P)-dependent oxidoreductase n=1 Tax=uncultured Paraglaciecola sp. TaxID=1765024 RepID=UPI002635532A|nr:NAD(P)-dependent oxidoreductase [uncultured Paraglaciecola sp.]